MYVYIHIDMGAGAPRAAPIYVCMYIYIHKYISTYIDMGAGAPRAAPARRARGCRRQGAGTLGVFTARTL